MSRPMRLSLLTFAVALLAACAAAPAPTPPAKPDSPVADTELRDTIQKPLNRAKSVEKTVMDAKDKQDQQLQNEEDGSSSASSQ